MRDAGAKRLAQAETLALVSAGYAGQAARMKDWSLFSVSTLDRSDAASGFGGSRLRLAIPNLTLLQSEDFEVDPTTHRAQQAKPGHSRFGSRLLTGWLFRTVLALRSASPWHETWPPAFPRSVATIIGLPTWSRMFVAESCVSQCPPGS